MFKRLQANSYDGTIMVVQFVIVIYCIAPASPKVTFSKPAIQEY